MQPGRAAPFFFLLFAEFQPDDLHAHLVVAYAREEAEKAGDRRVLEVVVAEHIAPAQDPQRGAIRVGGHDLREFTCGSLLCNISMVFQNVYLFHDTIRANILFGKPDATEEEMIKAAKKARCHDFIMALPDGYGTVVGEGGGTLSGGEKQRISIARAILKNAPIIILDEATASCIYTQKGNKKIRKPQAANQTALIFDRRAAARLLSINSIRRLCWS